MGLDMEVTGNFASTLGPIQRCYEVAWSGTPFDGVADWTIDVYVTGDTQAPRSYDAWVTYDNSKVHVLQVAPTDPLIKMPGAMNLSTYYQERAAFGASYFSPPYNGTLGNGTVVRIALDIGGSGLVTFGFANGAYRSEAGLHSVTTVSAQLAINRTCSSSVGGLAELPDVASGTGSSGQYSLAVAVGAVTGAIVLVAGAMYANSAGPGRAIWHSPEAAGLPAKRMRQRRRRDE
jgi:hypothetical protein